MKRKYVKYFGLMAVCAALLWSEKGALQAEAAETSTVEVMHEVDHAVGMEETDSVKENGIIINADTDIEALMDGNNLVIPEGTTVIESGAFSGMKFDGTLIIPEGVTEIGDYAFYGCGFSGDLVIPSTVKRIGCLAFAECDFDGSLTIKDGVEIIDMGAFYSCNFTGNLLIPKSVSEIGGEAFARNDSEDGDSIIVILNEDIKISQCAFIEYVKYSVYYSTWTSYYGYFYDGVLEEYYYYYFDDDYYWSDIYFAGKNQTFSCTYNDRVFASNVTVHAPVMSGVRSHVASESDASYVQWESIYQVEELTISTTELTMDIGDTKQLTYEVIPFVAADQDFYWTSSDENVVTVADGLVTAVAPGTATVEVYCTSGATQTCEITVEKDFPFEDVKTNSWEYAGIYYAYQHGMMSGIAKTKFSPADKLSRSQFVTVLYSYSGSPSVYYREQYSDVPASEWFTKPVIWATNNGVTAGIGNGRFGVENYISREQFVTMLYAYARNNGVVIETPTGSLSAYPDADKVSPWAKAAVLWAVNNGLISGKSANGKLYISPDGNTTRAECATIMMQYDMKFGTN